MSVTDSNTQTLSYTELRNHIVELSGGLVESGLEPCEPVAIFAPNSAEWIIAALAVIAAGGLLVPLDMRLPLQLLAHEITDSGCTKFFASRHTLQNLLAAAPKGSDLKVYLLGTTEDQIGESGDFQSWKSLRRDKVTTLPVISPDQDAVLFYTSGTTGLPKGVPLSHKNLIANLMGLREHKLAYPGVRALVPLPLHHVYPFMVGLLAPLDGGSTVVLPAAVTGPEIANALKLGDVTVMIGVPGLYEAFVTSIRRQIEARGTLVAILLKWLLKSSAWLRQRLGLRVGRFLLYPLHQAIGPQLRILASGGAALKDEIAWELEALGWEVLTGYGLTETAPIISFTTIGERKVGSAGRPLMGLEIRIASDEGLPGGEVQVRGPNVFAGYHNRPEATKHAFTSDGWFRTGDLGSIDQEGYLRIFGRADEMIVLAGGKNVQPEEIEAAYDNSPGLREVAILEQDGRLAALIVPDAITVQQNGQSKIDNAVRKALASGSKKLRSHERVSDYRITFDPLPRTALGKLKRHLLRDLFDETPSSTIHPQTEELGLPESDRRLIASASARTIMETLQQLSPGRPVTLDANLQSELGIDSLGWVSLTLELERQQGLYLDESTISSLTTVRSLIEAALFTQQQTFTRRSESPIATKKLLWLEPSGPLVEWTGLLLLSVNRLILRTFFRLRVTGTELLPADPPFVLAPNHVSFLDAFALAAAIPDRILINTFWAGTVDYLFKSKLRRAFSRITHVFPIDPVESPISSLLMGAEVLSHGRVLVWFPEGRRSLDGKLKKFMPGIGRLIREADWQVVPVHIAGTFEAWPVNKRFPRLLTVSVHFGVPAARDELVSEGTGETADARLADGLRRRLLALILSNAPGTH